MFQIFVGDSCPVNSSVVDGGCRCDDGFDEENGACVPGDKNNGPPDPCIGNPCNGANGNKFERQPIYRGANGFELSLAYNTYDGGQATRFGRHWSDSLDRRISTDVVAHRPDGKAYGFTPSSGNWVADADTNDRLTELKDPTGRRTGWQLYVAAGDETESYDAFGKLLSIRSRAGLMQTLSYSDGTSGPNGGVVLDANGQPTATPLPKGLLIRAADNFGRLLAFGYDASSRVVALTDPAGGAYQFAYDPNNNLASVTFPDGKVRAYLYNEPANTGGANFPNTLTGITDENGDRFATFKYDAQRRVVSTEHAGAMRYTLSYAPGATTVTDPQGTARNYGFQFALQAFKNTGISGPACPSCGPAAQTYDANNNVVSRTDWNGNVTVYGYDLARNLEISRTEAFGTPQARTISTQWHPVFRLPAKIAEPLRITSFVYNGDGGASCGVQPDFATLLPGVLCSKTIQATTDATGTAGFGGIATGTPRTWGYTYDTHGSVRTMDGPRTDVSDVTTYTFWFDDSPDLGRRGQVATITNARGHVTSITGYNAHGQPGTIVDPNGLTTTLSYDARQRLVSRNVGGEITSYAYDGVGQLTKVTLPDGSFLSYSYDAAHRLTGIADNLGNRIAYTLDAMGNRTQEQVFDPANALAQTRSRVFDNLNRLFQEIGATGQTTQYAYDNQGNVTSLTDPLNHATSNQYDALNRLVQVTDPNLGQTRYAYDGLDQLVSVTDPRNLATSYNYDGLANLNSQVSPDTGATASTYDAAGNLLTQTDAKGQVTTYAYDALNRVTLITFADGSTQAYSYDGFSTNKGRLTGVSNSSNVLGLTYDDHGRILFQTRIINGLFHTLTYTYDAFGRLSSLNYPSGTTVTYSYDALGRIGQVSAATLNGQAQVVASNITYQPFGGVKSYTLANGRIYTRGFDLDGRISSYTQGAQTFAIGYDAASRISFIADAANAANSNTYSYDNLDRLIGAVLPNLPFAYSYDAVGNRTSKTAGSATDTYAYDATSNRIASIAAQGGATRNFAFDANGSTTADGNNLYVYDTRGRMVQSTGALGVTTYEVNGLGQRTRKTNSSDDRFFLYDAGGRLIEEIDPSGKPKREYIYLNDIPLAVIQ